MINKLMGPILIVSIGLVGALSIYRVNWQETWKGEFIDGETQNSIEEAFDQALIIREEAIHFWNAFRFQLFGEFTEGVVAGKNGWLFSSEEYQSDLDFETKLFQSIDRISDTVGALAAEGTEVFVILLPDKARIEQEKLFFPRPAQVEARYDTALIALENRGIEIQDLRPVIANAHLTAPVFFKTDTHWTPHGAQVVANFVAPVLLKNIQTRSHFETEQTGQAEFIGDLFNFSEMGKLHEALGIHKNRIQLWNTTAALEEETELSLFGALPEQAALVGTSYSAIKKWNFLGFLQQASQTDIVNYATEGRGPFDPMIDYLKHRAGSAQNEGVVIWEIPERYLTQNQRTKP